MGNCLKTQLKENIQNESLVKMGELRIYTNTFNAGSGKHELSNTKTMIISSDKPLYSDSDRTIPTDNPLTVPAGTTAIFYPSSNAVVKVSEKYTLSRISLPDNSIIDGNDFKYTTLHNFAVYSGTAFSTSLDVALSNYEDFSIQLESFILPRGNEISDISYINKFIVLNSGSIESESVNYKGDLSQVLAARPDKDKITKIKMRPTQISLLNGGDLSFIREYTNLTEFDTTNISFTGKLLDNFGELINITRLLFSSTLYTEVEDVAGLFNAWKENGKKNSSCLCYLGSNKTLNGGTWTNGSTVTFDSNGDWSIS